MASPWPRAAMTPTVRRSPFGKTQPYEAGILPQSSSTRPAHRPADLVRHGDFQLEAEVHLVELRADVPGGDAGGAVGADDHLRGDLRTVREPGRRVPVRLVDRANLGPLPEPRAVLLGPLQQRGVELIAHHHREQRLAVRTGELLPAAQRDRGPADLVACGHVDQAARGGAGRADQAAAARLVPRVLGPLKHDCSRSRRGRGTRRGQPGRSRPDDGDIPHITFLHTKQLRGPPRAEPAVAARRTGAAAYPLVNPGATRPHGVVRAAADLRKNPQKSCWFLAACFLIQVQGRGRQG